MNLESDFDSDINAIGSILRNRLKEKAAAEKVNKTRDDYFSNVEKLSRDVAVRTGTLLPEGSKVKAPALGGSKGVYEVDNALDDSNPLKGLGSQVMSVAQSLKGKKIKGNYSGEQIVDEVYKVALADRLPAAYEHKLKQETSIFGSKTGELPGYEEFRARFDAENRPDVAAYYKGVTPEGIAKNLGIAAAGNVVLEGVGRAAKSVGLKGLANVAGRGIFGLPAVGAAGFVTKGVGLALMTAADFAVMDAATEAVGQSAWAKARPGELKVVGAELLAGGGAALGMAPVLRGAEKRITKAIKEHAYDKVRNEAAAEVLNNTGTVSSLMDFHKSLKKLERSKTVNVAQVDEFVTRNQKVVKEFELDKAFRDYNPAPPEGHSIFSAQGISRMREKERIKAAEEAMSSFEKAPSVETPSMLKALDDPANITRAGVPTVIKEGEQKLAGDVIEGMPPSSTSKLLPGTEVTERGLTVYKQIGTPAKVADDGWLGTSSVSGDGITKLEAEVDDFAFKSYTPALEGRGTSLALPAPVEKALGSNMPLRGRVALRAAFEQNKGLTNTVIEMGQTGPATMTPQNLNKIAEWHAHHVGSSKIPVSLLSDDVAVVSTVKMTNEKLAGRAVKFKGEKKTATQTALNTGLEDASHSQKVRVLDKAGIEEAKELASEGIPPTLAVPLAASNSVARKVRRFPKQEAKRDADIVTATKRDQVEAAKVTQKIVAAPSKGEGLTVADEANLLKAGGTKSIPEIGQATGVVKTPEEIARFKAAKKRQQSGRLSKVFASKEEKMAADAALGDIGSDVSPEVASIMKSALVTVPLAAAAFVTLDGNEAEAGVPGSVSALAVGMAKKAFGEKVADLIGNIRNSSLVAEKGNVMGQVAKWMDGVSADSSMAAIKETSSKIPEWIRSKVLTPAVVADRFYKAESNPLVEWGTRITAVHNNVQMHTQTVKEIISMVPGYRSATKEIKEMTKPLLQKYEEPILKQGYHLGMLEQAKKALAGVNRKKEPEAFAEAFAEVKLHATALRDAKLATKGYEADWTATMQGVAQKHPSARIALALEDTADFVHYPWLKGMMQPSEMSAVSRLKDLNKVTAGRIEEAGGVTVKARPYAHHALHPDSDSEMLKKAFTVYSMNPENAVVLAKLHSRKAGSKMMMPDVEYMYAKYIPEIERRIQGMKFWKKGEAGGWHAHVKELRASGRMTPELNQFWEDVNKSLSPVSRSNAAQWVNRYYAGEVLWRLFASPSVGFKHLMKQTGNLAIFPPDVWAKGIAKAPGIMLRAKALEVQEKFPKIFESLGVKIKSNEATDLVRSMTNQGKYNNAIAELDMFDAPVNKFDRILGKINEAGSFIVGGVEAFDRTATVLMGLEMAAKKGMTPSQATFAVYDSIIKANFLSGAHNPAWVRDPFARAFFMFQGTPFKLAEQRFLMAEKAGKSLSAAAKETWNQMKELKTFIKEGEYRVKHGMILDALNSEKDIFGQSVAKQFATNALIMGGLIGGVSAAADWDISDQVFHLPFVKMKGETPGIMLNPVTNAAYKTWNKRHDEDRDLLFTEFWNNWAGSSGPAPSVFRKLTRLNENDIPEIYKNSKMRYFFSVPATKE